MAVNIPTRTPTGPTRRRGSISLSGANVQSITPDSDTGLLIPLQPTPDPTLAGQAAGAEGVAIGRGLQQVGEALSNVAADFAQVEEKRRSRKAAVDLADKVSTYNEAATAELRRTNSEADLSRDEVLQGYGAFLAQQREAMLDAHIAAGGTADSTARLAARLRDIESNLTITSATLSAEIGLQKVTDRLDTDLSALIADVQSDPSRLGDALGRFDARMDDLTPGLDEGPERALRQHGRNVLTSTAINRTLGAGAVTGAARQLEAATRSGLLDADTTAGLTARITDARLQQNAARFRIAEAEVALGRPLNDEEILRAFDLDPPGSGVTVNVGGGESGSGALTSEPVKTNLLTRDIDLSLKLLEDMGNVERVVLGRLPTTDAFTLRTTIESIQGRLAFDNLINIKQTSGAGLGALSDKELEALSNLAGSLSTDLSKEVLQSNLRDLRDVLVAAETGDEGLIRATVKTAIGRNKTPELSQIGTQEEVDKLPSGTIFIWTPTGQKLRKE